LREHYPDNKTEVVAELVGRTVPSCYLKAAALGLKKSATYLASDDAYRFRRGDHPGAATQFRKGQVPPNKGLRRPGWAPGRMASTQFKSGQRSGVAAKLYKPIGTERISKDGYLERKIHDGMPLQSRWRAVHLITWEAKNGPMPDGHCVCFRDGNRMNFAEDNLELISRAERMRRNSYHFNYPKEVGQLIQLKGALQRKLNRRSQK
jgi:rhodanese-related sulfurtransferase